MSESDRTQISHIVRELEALRDDHGDLPILIDKGPGDDAYVGTRTFKDGDKFAVIGLSHTRSVDTDSTRPGGDDVE